MNILEAPKDLVEEVADVVIAQLLASEQLVQVRLHQVLHNVAEEDSRDPQVGGSRRHLVKEKRFSQPGYIFPPTRALSPLPW